MAESETRRSKSEYQVRELTVAAEAIKAYYQALTAQAAIGQYEALLRAGHEDVQETQTGSAPARPPGPTSWIWKSSSWKPNRNSPKPRLITRWLSPT